MSLVQFRVNNKEFSSFKEIFQYLDQQPQEDRWALTQSLLRLRTGVIQQFEQFDAEPLQIIGEKKAWEFVDLDQNTLMIHLGPLQTAVKSARREADREINNREKILSGWGPEVSTLFETSTRHELGQLVKAVQKHPVYKDARDRINNFCY